MVENKARLGISIGEVLASGILKVIGWRVEVMEPVPDKCVLVGAPHTSNWDLPIALLMLWKTGIKFHWLGKKEVFPGPIGWFMGKLGGVPVDRKSKHNVVDQIVNWFSKHEVLRVGVTPEGTRGKTGYWKTGFYYMALGAQVPIVMAFIDYGQKRIGFGPQFFPSGDIEADFEILRAFYSDMTALYPLNVGEIAIRPS